MNVLIVGAGVFGVTAALELRRRGHDVRVLDPGTLPHPDAASTDACKIIRFDYGAEAHWIELAELCRERWLRWNETLGETVFHQVGLACLTAAPLRAGTFEGDSHAALTKRGWSLQRLAGDVLGRTLPMFAADHYRDGYLNPHAGWSPSGRVMALLIAAARQAGVKFEEQRGVARLAEKGGRIVGVIDARGVEARADLTVVAAGAWTPELLPFLGDRLRCSGQPVLQFRVEDPTIFQPPRFVVWTSDIGTTGWYGFPADAAGVLKVGNHGPGRPRTEDLHVLPADDERRCRAFLARCIPALADAPVVGARLCLYCDSFDHAFFIDHDPGRPGLFVAAGGSGHGFKFAPMLGEIIADAVERVPHPYGGRFRWRDYSQPVAESARRVD